MLGVSWNLGVWVREWWDEEEGEALEIHQPRIPAIQTRRMLEKLKRKDCVLVGGVVGLAAGISFSFGGSRSGTTGERCWAEILLLRLS